MNDKEWGVVQHLCVEADTKAALLGAVMVAMTEHKQITHWKLANGELFLYWWENDNAMPFLTPLNKCEDIVNVCWDWLKCADYSKATKHDTDGDLKAGYKIEAVGYNSVAFKITPVYIIYGK